jgi:hypothetical protein
VRIVSYSALGKAAGGQRTARLVGAANLGRRGVVAVDQVVAGRAGREPSAASLLAGITLAAPLLRWSVCRNLAGEKVADRGLDEGRLVRPGLSDDVGREGEDRPGGEGLGEHCGIEFDESWRRLSGRQNCRGAMSIGGFWRGNQLTRSRYRIDSSKKCSVEDVGSRDMGNEWLEHETLGKERLVLQVKIVVRVKCRVGCENGR